MTYKQLRDDTLRLLDRFSVAGGEVSPTYNNQADILKRLPSLLNDGQMLIATTVRPSTELMELKPYSAVRMGKWLRFILPEDFYRLSGRGLAVVQGDDCFRSHEFQLLGSAALLVPESLSAPLRWSITAIPCPSIPMPRRMTAPTTLPILTLCCPITRRRILLCRMTASFMPPCSTSLRRGWSGCVSLPRLSG